tara:strand:- start:564 stop:1280 length:717 start_codon:yes stop_codon:yes gene_type:complete
MKKLSVRSLIPNIFTFISLTLGLTAIKFAIESKWQISVMLVIFASFLDNIDGKLARLLKSDSNFGVELDSLSDFISFGITPAIIVYLWANSFSMETTWSIVVFYAICSSSRLAKFNISNIEKTNKDLRLKFFSGISTPAAAGLSLLPLMINFRFDLDLSSSEIFFKFFLFVPAILMISNIPTYSLKGLKIEKKFIPFAIILFAGFISLLLTDFWLGMILFIIIYFLTIPLAIYESRKY